MEENPMVYTVQEAAALLKVHIQTIHKLLRENKLQGVRVGRDWRVSAAALNEFVNGGSTPKRGRPRKQEKGGYAQ